MIAGASHSSLHRIPSLHPHRRTSIQRELDLLQPRILLSLIQPKLILLDEPATFVELTSDSRRFKQDRQVLLGSPGDPLVDEFRADLEFLKVWMYGESAQVPLIYQSRAWEEKR
jgi:hypothetical protein